MTYFSLVGILFMKNYSDIKEEMLQIEVIISGEKNNLSNGTEARILKIEIDGIEKDLEQFLIEQNDFKYENEMLLGYEGRFFFSIKKTSNVGIQFLKHPWSGIVQIKIDSIGINEKIDLYHSENDTYEFQYIWNWNEIWEKSYHLQGMSKVSLGILYILIAGILYILLKIIKNFFIHIKKGSLKISHLLEMAVACFGIEILTLYPLFHLFKEKLIFIIFILALYWLVKNRTYFLEKLQYIYAIIYVLVATLMIFLLPPAHVPDEFAHYVKTYEASIIGDSHKTLREGYEHEGEVYIYLPKSVMNLSETFYENVQMYDVKYDLEKYYCLYTEKLNIEDLSEDIFWFGNTINLNPLSYIPGIITHMFLNFTNISPVLIMQIIRFINMIIVYILGYYTILITPICKKIFFIIMLLPITIQQSIGINQDWITNTLCFFFIAYIFAMKEKKEFEKKDYFVLLILSFLLGNVKVVYFWIVLLIFTIPAEKFKNKKYEWLEKITIILPAMILSLYLCITKSQTTISKGELPYYSLDFIIRNPFKTVEIYFNTLLEEGFYHFVEGLITGFGWYTHYKRYLISYIESILVILMVLGANEYEKINKQIRLCCVGIFVLSCSFVYTSMFLGWTQIDSEMVLGLQPRYFIIPLLCLYVACQNSKLCFLDLKNKNLYYAISMLGILFSSILTIAMGFYN